jgi:hypothetical protein
MLRAVSVVVSAPARRWRILAASALITGLAGFPVVSSGSAAAAQMATARTALTAAAAGINAGGGTWNNAHQIPGLAALATQHIDEVDTVSCSSPGNCSAGGLFVTPANGDGGEAFVANETGGVWGKAEEVPGTAALNAGDGGADVASMSCRSNGNCSAGGEYVESSGGEQAFVVDEVNGTWGTAVEAPGTAALNVGDGAQITAVSCGSPGNCSAMGQYSDGALLPLDQVFVIDEVNGTWQNAQQIPGTGTLNAGQDAFIGELSCPSPGNCSAGGTYVDASNHEQAFVVSEVNGTWGTAIEVPGTATLNAGGSGGASSVSCASAGNCLVGGTYAPNRRHLQAFVASEQNGTWGTAREVPGTGALNAGGFAHVYAVSCASVGNCGVAGGYTDSSGNGQAYVVNQVGGIWGKAEQVPGTAALENGGSTQIVAMSCASAGNCSAVGGYSLPCQGIQCADQQALVVSEVNGTWGNAEEIPNTATLNKGNFAGTNAVSCASAGRCLAGGFYSVNEANQQAFVASET